jgi:hypothetical protein
MVLIDNDIRVYLDLKGLKENEHTDDVQVFQARHLTAYLLGTLFTLFVVNPKVGSVETYTFTLM